MAVVGGTTRRRFLGGAAALGASGTLAGVLERAAALGAQPATKGEWLAGDLHVHTCFSHDVLCGGLSDDNTGPEDIYTLGWNVEQRFQQASERDLDYLAISDHDDIRSITDSGFGRPGVIALPCYESSIHGHAHMIGAKKKYDKGDSSVPAARAMARALRADGGIFQANHPAYSAFEASLFVDPVDTDGACCSDCTEMHWKYGFDVVPDLIEAWNAASPPNSVAEGYWECWLDRGERLGATGGSDSHWVTTNVLQGPGQPCTWVLSPERSAAGVIAGLRGGRTSISYGYPSLGAPLFVIEGDPKRDGSFTALLGDEIPPGTPMRARVLRNPASGTVRVRANGKTLLSAPLKRSGEVHFKAPDEPGWIRASLIMDTADSPLALPCTLIAGESLLQPACRERHMLAAMTSAMYVSSPGSSIPTFRIAVEPAFPAARLLEKGLQIAVTARHPGSVRSQLKAVVGGKRRVIAQSLGELTLPGRLDVTMQTTGAGHKLARTLDKPVEAHLVVRHRDELTLKTRTATRTVVLT
jgi:hypothetical protein